ncbi:MAG: hypothetical protein AAGF71_07385 [Pseudomonadota bacterium]
MADTHPLVKLLGAWEADTSEARYRIVQACTTDDFYYADPHSGPLSGQAAFLGFLNIVKTRLPDGAMVPEGKMDQHETHARLPFTLMRSGAPVRSGIYFADLDPNNRVARLVGFLE